MELTCMSVPRAKLSIVTCLWLSYIPSFRPPLILAPPLILHSSFPSILACLWFSSYFLAYLVVRLSSTKIIVILIVAVVIVQMKLLLLLRRILPLEVTTSTTIVAWCIYYYYCDWHLLFAVLAIAISTCAMNTNTSKAVLRPVLTTKATPAIITIEAHINNKVITIILAMSRLPCLSHCCLPLDCSYSFWERWIVVWLSIGGSQDNSVRTCMLRDHVHELSSNGGVWNLTCLHQWSETRYNIKLEPDCKHQAYARPYVWHVKCVPLAQDEWLRTWMATEIVKHWLHEDTGSN